MTRVRLVDLVHTRSGDKGDSANVGVIAYEPDVYPYMVEQLTEEHVKSYFKDFVAGEVERFELPNLCALNFVLHRALDGGGTVSLRTDAQGKVLSAALLRMELDVPEELAERMGGRGRVPEGWTPASDRGAPDE